MLFAVVNGAQCISRMLPQHATICNFKYVLVGEWWHSLGTWFYNGRIVITFLTATKLNVTNPEYYLFGRVSYNMFLWRKRIFALSQTEIQPRLIYSQWMWHFFFFFFCTKIAKAKYNFELDLRSPLNINLYFQKQFLTYITQLFFSY